MFRYRWKEILEGVGILSIVVSLVFVGLQVRQEQEIARAQLGSETSELASAIYLTTTDSDFASAYSKMLNNPSELTPSETVQVNGFLSVVAELIFRDCYLVDRGIFPECHSSIEIHGKRFFGNKYAQSWWRHNRPPTLYGLTEDIDSLIFGLDEESNQSMLERIQSEM